MYSPDEPDFYLRHDFEGEYSDSGVPYLDARCTLTAADRSDNLVIYWPQHEDRHHLRLFDRL